MATATNPSVLPGLGISAAECAQVCADGGSPYGEVFFPRAFRQKTPTFHDDIWDLLEDRAHRYVALEVFRGGAKTTTLRAYTSKRIAYGISRTIMYVSEAQNHSERSVRWLKKQVEYNSLWREVFGLEVGDKWRDDIIEIRHKRFGFTITVIALGITGQTRGVNIDDYRPDLIVVDDPCNEENTGTPEQREKIEERFYAALARSLAPRGEVPDAKMVLLQTSLDSEDLINKCHRDSSWATRKFSCFNEQGESRWPERHPTEDLKAEKNGYIERGQLHIWLREMECTIVSPEAAAFRQEWLKFWDTLPESMVVHGGIDPVPPPSPREEKTGYKTKDYESLALVGKSKGNYYLLDYKYSRGHTPEWTIAAFFSMMAQWKPLKWRVEGVNYQRTLKWILEKAMIERGRFIQVDVAPADKRKKAHRIIQALSGIASQGRLYVHRSHAEFISQFVAYPNLAHDDVLDSVSHALESAAGFGIETDYESLEEEEAQIPDLEEVLGGWRGAP